VSITTALFALVLSPRQSIMKSWRQEGHPVNDKKSYNQLLF